MFYYMVIAWILGQSFAKQIPNFVFVLTDDQDVMLSGLSPMTNVKKLIAHRGITFTNTFVNSPICCPSRSTILTGKYAHNTNVRNNSLSGNCSSRQWQKKFEPISIAAILKSTKNYTTFYAGKYLNQYGARKAGGTQHVPVGYDWWLGLKGNSQYYNYTLSVNGTANFFPNIYLTDLMTGYAMDFLYVNGKKPFFMMLAPPAPHAPFTPAPRHRHKFPNTKAVRTPSFNYTALKKHWLVGMGLDHLPQNVSVLDDIQKRRLQTLLAVDEMVEKVVSKLEQYGIFENTYFIFMSDNGYHIGQFTQPWDKRQPYETDIRVPFVMSGPGIPRNTSTDFPISAVDIAPMIFDLVGITTNTDGNSFKGQLLNSNSSTYYDKFILIEYWGEGNSQSVDSRCPWGRDNNLAVCSLDSWCKCQDSRNNTYTCFMQLSNTWKVKFCSFEDGTFEVYDLVQDPFELNNIYGLLSEEQKLYHKTKLECIKNSNLDCLF